MKRSFLLSGALFLAVPAVAIAADMPAIRERALVKTADGHKVGFVDRVLTGGDGAPSGVQIIYDGRFVVIPASTLTGADKGLVTSLTSKEVNKL